MTINISKCFYSKDKLSSVHRKAIVRKLRWIFSFELICVFKVESIELTNIAENPEDNSDSGISPNDSEVDVLIFDRKWCFLLKRKTISIRLDNHVRNHKSALNGRGDEVDEKWYIVASQVFLPFMIAGLGMVAAGLVLERVKVSHRWLLSICFHSRI